MKDFIWIFKRVVNVVITILGLIIPFLVFTPLAKQAYFVSLIFIGYGIYQLDIPKRIEERENLPELRHHRQYIRIIDSIFFTIFYFLNSRFIDDVEIIITEGVGNSNIFHALSHFLFAVADLIAIIIILVSSERLKLRRLTPSLLSKASQGRRGLISTL